MFEALLSLLFLVAAMPNAEEPLSAPPQLMAAAPVLQIKGKDGVVFDQADLSKNPNIVIVGEGYALFDRDPKIWGEAEIDKSDNSVGFNCNAKQCGDGVNLDISKTEYSDDGKTLTHDAWLKAMTTIGPKTKPIVTGKSKVTFPNSGRIVTASREKAALIESRIVSSSGKIWSGFSLNFPRDAFYVRIAVTGPLKLRDKVRAMVFETVKRVKVP